MTHSTPEPDEGIQHATGRRDRLGPDPRVVLRPGDRLVTHAEVIKEMTTFTVA